MRLFLLAVTPRPNVGHFGLGCFDPYISATKKKQRGRFGHNYKLWVGVRLVHILGNTCLSNLIYHISPKMLLVLKVHVFTSRDENCVGPDQVGSWLIWICCVLNKKKINPDSA